MSGSVWYISVSKKKLEFKKYPTRKKKKKSASKKSSRTRNSFISLFFLLTLMSFSTLISAEAINDTFHINLQTTFSNGTIEAGTFTFAFNITDNSSTLCGPNVTYNHSTVQTTNDRGILSVYLPTTGSDGGNLSTLDFDKQYYLCYYRDGTLKDVSQLGRVPYSFKATQVNLSEINVDSNLTLGSYNISASSGFFTGMVGINTSSPQNILNVVGDANITGTLYAGTLDASTLDTYDSAFFMPLNTSVYGNFDFNGGWTGGGLSIDGGDLYAQTIYVYNITSLNVTEQNLSIIDDLLVFGNTSLKQHLLLKQENDASTPTLAFGDEDSGFYESSDDLIRLSLGGSLKYSFTQSVFTNSGGSAMMLEAPTTTNPNILPAYSDSDTGIGWGGDGILSLIANATNIVNVTPTGIGINGNVGIATATPQNTLNVIGDLNVTGTIYGAGDTNISDTFVPYTGAIKDVNLGSYNFYAGGSVLTAIYQIGSSRVGIGTSSPDSQTILHVKVDNILGLPALSDADILLQDTSTSTDEAVISIIGGNGTGSSMIDFGDSNDEDAGAIDYDHDTDSFRFRTNGVADRVIIDSSGNLTVDSSTLFVDAVSNGVGIGTTSLEGKFDVYTSSGNTNMYITSNTDDSYIWMDSGEDGAGTEQSGIVFQNNSNSIWLIAKDTNNDFRLYDYIRGSNVIEIADNGNMYLMQDGGNVGVGTASPEAELDVSGMTQTQGFFMQSSDNRSKVLLQFNEYIASGATPENWKIATLPATSASTGELVRIVFDGGGPGSTNKFSGEIIFGNRNGFTGEIVSWAGITPPGHTLIRAFNQTGDGSIDIYLSLMGTTWTHGAVSIYAPSFSGGTNSPTIYKEPADVGASPTGTLVFGTNTSTPLIYSDIYNSEVGIGTTSPEAKLHVSTGANADSGAIQMQLGSPSDSARKMVIQKNTTSPYDTDIYWSYHATTEAGDLGFHASQDSGALVTFESDGDVGIGDTSPAVKLSVNSGTANAVASFTSSDASAYLPITDSAATWSIGTTGSDFIISEADGLGTDRFHIDTSTGNIEIGGNLTLNNDDILGVNKLTVTTIDPVYNIDGDKYSTYVASIVGVKEEITGTLMLNSDYVIDFNKLKIGSDLWLFYQITDFGEDMENLQIMLTPGFDGDVWYKKDPEKNTLTIYGSQKGEVSYRFTANRFDHLEWSTYAGSDNENLGINVKLKK